MPIDELSLEQAERIKALINKPERESNLERLAEVALNFLDLFLDDYIAELKMKKAKTHGRG